MRTALKNCIDAEVESFIAGGESAEELLDVIQWVISLYREVK